jgi:alpha-galactosidase
MGWNSWDCYGMTVTEAEVESAADYMSTHLREYGWEFVVVDGGWSMPGKTTPVAGSGTIVPHELDSYGRLVPSLDRFPSAAHGVGFKVIADYIHQRGLKFGIHVMRGIPRKAVEVNAPILGTNYRARDIADTNSVCSWSTDMYGIDMSHPGGQAYYDSIVSLYASWDVDYIKADDMSSPYYPHEIGAFARAIHATGRDIVLSLSPGNVQPAAKCIDHLLSHCELWRICPDFWDNWDGGPAHFSTLKAQFDHCRRAAQYAGPGHWSDADMLPLGRLGPRPPEGIDRPTHFTKDEQVTVMSLWAIARSPLMMGGDLPSLDAWTLSLITNPEVLAVNQKSSDQRELFRRGDEVVWFAKAPDEKVYLALFNLADQPATISVPLAFLDEPRVRRVRDLWARKDAGTVDGTLTRSLAPHGSFLCQLT